MVRIVLQAFQGYHTSEAYEGFNFEMAQRQRDAHRASTTRLYDLPADDARPNSETAVERLLRESSQLEPPEEVPPIEDVPMEDAPMDDVPMEDVRRPGSPIVIRDDTPDATESDSEVVSQG